MRDEQGEIVPSCRVQTDIEGRGGAEAALQVGDLEFHRIVDDIPALLAVATADGELVLVNRQGLEYFGRTLEELRGWRTSDLIHPDDLPGVIAAWRRSVDTGEPYDIEHRARGADGVYRWFHVRARPARDVAGRITRWYILHSDIDSRKRVEALLAGQTRLAEMVASGCSLPVVLDALCRLVEDAVGGCQCSIQLLEPGGASFQLGAAPSLPASYSEALREMPVRAEAGPGAMAACLKEQVIVPDVASDGRFDAHGWRALALAHDLRSCWSTPIVSLAGKVIGTFAIYQHEPGSPTSLQRELIAQFTHLASIAIERSWGEAVLRRSEGFLAEAQRLSSTGSFSWHVATNEITWSEETYHIFELDRAQPVTWERIAARIHPEDVRAFRDQLERARRDGRDVELEHRLQMPDGSVKYVRVVAHATQNEDRELEYIGAVQDVTERRLAEDALGKVRSELAHVARVTTLGALTASIAHEVNQPLSGVITNASTGLRMLEDDPPDVAGARETTRRVIRDANRASDVIAELRALFGKETAGTESVDLNEATRDVIALSRSELQRGGAAVRLELADDIPPVAGDRVQLQQVVLNLLLNAVEAMSGVADRPRQLVVSTERDADERVRLSVRDVGVGLDPGSVDRLFEAFYTTKSGGMGIGLSVSRSIIEGHHGRLWAVPNDGPGATFAFAIPQAAEQGIPGPRGVTVMSPTTARAPRALTCSRTVPRSTPPDRSGRRHHSARSTPSGERIASRDAPIVFVVDDDVVVRESLEVLIRHAGWQPETFTSAEEFLARPRVAVPSCLVLDISLPGVSGLELQERVAADRIDMPVIVITGHGDVPMTVRAMKAGAVEFLTKPFGDDALLNAVRQAIAGSHAVLGEAAEQRALRARYAALSRRERQVMALVISGLLNKRIGAQLGISEITVKAHRGRVMRKMRANSVADLVRMATRLDLPPVACTQCRRFIETIA